MKSKAYKDGVNARLSGDFEPACIYDPGSREYRDFADGFCAELPSCQTLIIKSQKQDVVESAYEC